MKSGYLKLYNANTSTPLGQTGQIWRKFWKLKMPPKVLNFVWRALNGVLPTGDNLIDKKILQSGVCPTCLQDTETILHCLVECNAAKQVWLKSSLGWRRSGPLLLDWFNSLIEIQLLNNYMKSSWFYGKFGMLETILSGKENHYSLKWLSRK